MRIRRGGDELGLAFVRVGVDRLESSLKPLRGGGRGGMAGGGGMQGGWASGDQPGMGAA